MSENEFHIQFCRDIAIYQKLASVNQVGVDLIVIYVFPIGIVRDTVKMNHGSVFVLQESPDQTARTMEMLVSKKYIS